MLSAIAPAADVRPESTAAPKCRQIIAAVAFIHGLSVADLSGPSRHRSIAWPRQQAMWLCRAKPGVSLTAIGRFLGDRDHTTVLHGVRQVERRIAAKDAATISKLAGAKELVSRGLDGQ